MFLIHCLVKPFPFRNSRIKALEKDKLQLSKDLEQKGKNSEKRFVGFIC